MSSLACPTHVTVSCDRGARGGTKSGGTRANADGSGSLGRGRVVRCTSIHLRRLPNPGTAWSTHGLRKPPPGRWCEGTAGGVTARNIAAPCLDIVRILLRCCTDGAVALNTQIVSRGVTRPRTLSLVTWLLTRWV